MRRKIRKEEKGEEEGEKKEPPPSELSPFLRNSKALLHFTGLLEVSL